MATTYNSPLDATTHYEPNPSRATFFSFNIIRIIEHDFENVYGNSDPSSKATMATMMQSRH